jgi:hypothetical protein
MGSGGKGGAEAERRRRLAEALRENLKRRKALARGRAAQAAPPEKPERLPDGSH